MYVPCTAGIPILNIKMLAYAHAYICACICTCILKHTYMHMDHALYYLIIYIK